MKDRKGDRGGKTGECEEDSGDDVQDGELGGAPVGKGAAGVEDQPEVGQVVAEALRLHLVAPLTHHLVEKKEKNILILSLLIQFTLQPCSLQSCKEESQNTQ